MTYSPVELWLLTIGALVCLAGGAIAVCVAALGVAIAAESAILRWRGAKQLYDLALRERQERMRQAFEKRMRMTQTSPTKDSVDG